jgi:hypothetical protein
VGLTHPFFFFESRCYRAGPHEAGTRTRSRSPRQPDRTKPASSKHQARAGQGRGQGPGHSASKGQKQAEREKATHEQRQAASAALKESRGPHDNNYNPTQNNAAHRANSHGLTTIYNPPPAGTHPYGAAGKGRTRHTQACPTGQPQAPTTHPPPSTTSNYGAATGQEAVSRTTSWPPPGEPAPITLQRPAAAQAAKASGGLSRRRMARMAGGSWLA